MYGPGADDPRGLADQLSLCRNLRERAATADLDLNDSVTSLAGVDRLVDASRDDPRAAGWLGSEAGTYLGTVIVHTVPGAHWHVAPNGHPVVRLASGQEVDVVRLGNDRVRLGVPTLVDAYDQALAGH